MAFEVGKAPYSKNIVDTRKFDRDKRALFGTKGDTKIREVGGEAAHVSPYEAFKIDTEGRAGEKYAMEVGAGTRNSITGLLQFHDVPPENVQPGETGGHDHEGGEGTYGYNYYLMHGPGKMRRLNILHDLNKLEGRQDYQTLKNLSEDELKGYLMEEFGVSEANVEKYTTGWEQEPFQFMETQRDIGMERTGLAKEKLASQYQTATASAQEAMGQSGFASSGTIQSGLNQQLQALTKDYEGIDLDVQAVGLDYEKGMYGEKQRQLDLMFDEIAAIPS